MKSFSELGLCDPLLLAVEEQGYEHPMPIQEQVIPHLLESHGDLIALAQTGTGKTAAYGLPLLQQLSGSLGETTGERSRLPQVLVLSPTRELCLQIADDLRLFATHLTAVRILAVYGGANIEPQIRSLRSGVDIVVATPGRMLDLMRRGAADLSQVRTLVLDEADEMLSMGFHDDLEAILEGVTTDHHTLLFSATMSPEVEKIAQQYLHSSTTIQVGSRNEGAENVNHIYYMVSAKDKYLALKRIVDYFPKIYAIVFCRTRMETQQVADNLIRDGYNADALHGDLSQQQRDFTMQKFRGHRTQLLVATDVAARGLDVDDLTHVINYGMPDDVEVYTHRSGRTGRAGKRGTSISIVHVRERHKIKQAEKTIKKEFVRALLPSPKDICTKQLYRVIDDIEHVDVMEEEIAPFLEEVNTRWTWLDKEELVKRVLSREFGRFLRYYANAPEIEDVSLDKTSRNEKRKQRAERGHEGGPRLPEPGYARLFITIGKTDGVFVRELIMLLNDHVRGPKVQLGRIDLMRNFSFVEVPEEDAQRVIGALRGLRVKGRVIDCQIADGQSAQERPPREAPRRGPQPAARGRRAPSGRPQRPNPEPPQHQHKFRKEDWMKFLHPELTQQEPEEEEGFARRYPRKK